MLDKLGQLLLSKALIPGVPIEFDALLNKQYKVIVFIVSATYKRLEWQYLHHEVGSNLKLR